jgi:glycerate-2-kinase
MKSGATIHEINTVRKHVSEVQGGQLAEIAYPARVVSLIFSDVPGDDIGMVASGPTVLDKTTIEDARAILEKYNILKTCRLDGCNLKETPKDPKIFEHVTNILVVGNTIATEAMRSKADELGYHARVATTTLHGEASRVGPTFIEELENGEAIIAAGETTVTVVGDGTGGRNQEVVLGALPFIEDELLISCASDGIDNSEAAGAIADQLTKAHAEEQRLHPNTYLTNNNSFMFFNLTEDHIYTGITGMNVSDLLVAIKPKVD